MIRFLVTQLLPYKTIVSRSKKILEKKWHRCFIIFTHFVGITYNPKSITFNEMHWQLKYIAMECVCFFKCSQYGDKKEVSEIFEPLFIFSDICLHINHSFSISATPLQTLFRPLKDWRTVNLEFGKKKNLLAQTDLWQV